MAEIFPESITRLPEADIPLHGLRAYLSQADDHQILFMQCDQEIEVPDHSHGSQWGVVLAGRIDLTIEGVRRTYTTGESFSIPEGAIHSARIYAGYADISFFDEKDRYKRKQPSASS